MLTLDAVKHHCSIDFTEDDDYLQRLMAAAQNHMESYCNRKLYTDRTAYEADVAAGITDSPMMMTDELELAQMMIVGHWYAVREAVSASPGTQVPMSAQMILDLNRHSSFYPSGGSDGGAD